MGPPVAGMNTNQGRVGLCQNSVRNPVKYCTSGAVISKRPSSPCAAISACAFRVLVANSLAGKPRVAVSGVMMPPAIALTLNGRLQ